MKTIKPLSAILLAVLLISLAACGPQNDAANNNTDTQENHQNQEQPSSNGNVDQNQTQNEDSNGSSSQTFEPLPAERQPVTITTEDGRTLEGFYYPAKIPNAPVVVLMHWAPGDMEDWRVIAPWLQNRQDELDSANFSPGHLAGLSMPLSESWLDDSWFPPLPEEVSFAILIFNFGGYGDSDGSRPTFLLDAKAAFQFAAALPAVDPDRISAMGASIGADGAVDGCNLFNQEADAGACLGAFSLSPGNFITDEFSYTEAVTKLDLEEVVVWCLAAEDDYESPATCLSASGDHYRTFIYPDTPHGMELLQPGFFPIDPAVEYDTLQLVQEWLEAVYGFELNQISID